MVGHTSMFGYSCMIPPQGEDRRTDRTHGTQSGGSLCQPDQLLRRQSPPPLRLNTPVQYFECAGQVGRLDMVNCNLFCSERM